jgi:hypothetical protein
MSIYKKSKQYQDYQRYLQEFQDQQNNKGKKKAFKTGSVSFEKEGENSSGVTSAGATTPVQIPTPGAEDTELQSEMAAKENFRKRKLSVFSSGDENVKKKKSPPGSNDPATEEEEDEDDDELDQDDAVEERGSYTQTPTCSVFHFRHQLQPSVPAISPSSSDQSSHLQLPARPPTPTSVLAHSYKRVGGGGFLPGRPITRVSDSRSKVPSTTVDIKGKGR